VQATKKIVLSGNVSECVHSFFHHTNSPVYICTFFLLFFFEKYLSRLYLLPLFIQYWHYVQRQLVVVSFFSWCAFEGRKKSFSLTKKKASEYFLSCASSVFWITDIFSNRHPTCNAEEFWGGSEIDSLFVVAQPSECFESSLCILAFFYVLTFFSCFNFF
jgi:hypothetical protein